MASTVVVQWAYEIAGEIASDAVKAMALAMSLTKSFDASIPEQIIALEDKTDCYEDTLNAYLVKLSAMNLSVHDNRILNTLLHTVSDIAVEMFQVSEGKLETHEYLNTLKAGGLCHCLLRAIRPVQCSV